MISTSAQYAVRAAMHVARDGGWRTSDEIARATAIPPGYLAKIMNLLTRARILESQRGSNGGFRPLRDPSITTVLDVVRAVDQAPDYGSCLSCRSERPDGCSANRFFADIEAEAERRMRGMTLARLLQDCA